MAARRLRPYAPSVPICVQPLVPFAERSIWNPVSFVELSFQFSRSSVDESAVTTSKEGADGGLGLVVPLTTSVFADTPPDIVKKLNTEFSAIVKSPDFAEQYLISKGFEPVGDSSEAFAKFIVEDQKKGKLLVDISGAKLEQ